MRLYEITGELVHILTAIHEQDGEVDEDMEARLDALELDLSSKVEGCCKLMREWELAAAGLQAEQRRLEKKRATLEKKRERLRSYVLNCLTSAEQWKVDAGNFTVRVNKARWSVEIEDASALPPEFVEVSERPRKKEIAEAYRRGETVPGARMREGNPSLVIK